MCVCLLCLWLSKPLCFGQVVLFQLKLDHMSCFPKSDDNREVSILALFIYGGDSPVGAAERLTARGILSFTGSALLLIFCLKPVKNSCAM